jgi:hypothetical protein
VRSLGPNLWVLDQPFKAGFLHLGTRTTIVKQSDGSLWIHSPGPHVRPLREKIEALGPVGALVAPNTMHHLFLGEAMELFPQARALASPGVDRKNPHLNLENLSGQRWDDLEQLLVQGMHTLREFVFFHPASGTLILTDLAFNMTVSEHFLTRVAMQLNAAYGRFGPSRLFGMLVSDRAQLKRSLEQIMEWPFRRVILAHGQVVEEDAAAVFREGFERKGWLR